MAKYLACGNIMSDGVVLPDGTLTRMNIGGPSMFALSGIRLFTDSCKLVTRSGADYTDTYGAWMDTNGLTRESIRVEVEHCTQHIIQHNADNSYTTTSKFGSEHLGYLKTSPADIEAAIGPDTKAFYLAQNVDRVFWKKIAELKERTGVKMMWEIEPNITDTERMMDVISVPDMFSLNWFEASRLFGIPKENDEDIINEIMKLPVELTLYRVGPRGAYAVTPTNAVFCGPVDPYGPSVDPTGCGNTSTGAALYAHMEGFDPAMVVAIANVAAGFNAAQYGPVPVVTEEITDLAMKLAREAAAGAKA